MGQILCCHRQDPTTLVPEEYTPIISECQVFYEDFPEAGLKDYECCSKNPGHPTFIPVKEFDLKHLPPDCRTKENLNFIKHWIDRTVKVVLTYTSPNRPSTYPNSTAPYPFCDYKGSKRTGRTGTGFIEDYSQRLRVITNGECPCHVCKTSANPVNYYIQVIITTATHVVYDDLEAERTVCTLFYDDEENQEVVKYLYGVKLWGSDNNTEERILQRCVKDRVEILFVTHDVELLGFLRRMESYRKVNYDLKTHGIIISHPHGQSKCITVGNILRHKTLLDKTTVTSVMVHRPHPNFMDRIASKISPNYSDNTYTYMKISGHAENGNSVSVEIGRGKICILCDKTTLAPTEPFGQYLDSFNSLKYGVEYKLKQVMVIFLPPGTKFTCHKESEYVRWITFPPGTKAATKSSGGKDLIPLPDNIKFLSPLLTCPSFQTYDIATCPGCSGAPVIRNFDFFKINTPNHSGAVSDGTNRSAVSFYFRFLKY